jgi:2-phosphoglycerate kinase
MNAYNQALQINRDLKKKLDKTFTIDEIKEVWTVLANQGIISATDLVEELEQRLK